MRALRIALVTAGLMAAGAVFGGIAGAAAGAAWVLLEGGFGGLARESEIVLFVGFLGGGLGAVLGPAVAWLMMRHVPLWLAVGGTTLGTMAGGILGALLGGPGSMFVFGILGFVMSAGYLQIRTSPDDRLLRDGGSARLPAGGG